MKRPKLLNVFGQKYKITYDNKDEEVFGETNTHLNLISIRNNIPEDKLLRVLAHGLTHAVLAESSLAHRKRFTEEEVCDLVGYYILPTLRSNPEITKFLIQEIENDDDSLEPSTHTEPKKEKTNE